MFRTKMKDESHESVLAQAEKSGHLIFSNRSLKSLPPVIGKYNLSDLQTVDVSHNKLCEYPQQLCSCNFLEFANCSKNLIKSLPDTFQQLQYLQHLDLSYNCLTTIPVCIFELQSLQILILASNKISELPSQCSHLLCLLHLDVSYNCLTAVPPQLSCLQHLRVLRLRHNRLTTVPSEWCSMQLRCLDLAANLLQAIPLEFRLLHGSLCELHLDLNPMLCPPAIVCSRGLKHVMKFLTVESIRTTRSRSSVELPWYCRRRTLQGLDSGFGSTNSTAAADDTLAADAGQVSRLSPAGSMSNSMSNSYSRLSCIDSSDLNVGTADAGKTGLSELRILNTERMSNVGMSNPAAMSNASMSNPAAVSNASMSNPAAVSNAGMSNPAAVSNASMSNPATASNAGMSNPAAIGDTNLRTPANVNDTNISNPAALSDTDMSNPAIVSSAEISSSPNVGDTKMSNPATISNSEMSATSENSIRVNSIGASDAAVSNASMSSTPVSNASMSSTPVSNASMSSTPVSNASMSSTPVSEFMSDADVNNFSDSSAKVQHDSPMSNPAMSGVRMSHVTVSHVSSRPSRPVQFTSSSCVLQRLQAQSSRLGCGSVLPRQTQQRVQEEIGGESDTQLRDDCSLQSRVPSLLPIMKSTMERRLCVRLPESAESLADSLRDGVLLCRLANQVAPRSIRCVHEAPQDHRLPPDLSRRNVEQFLDFCRSAGLPQMPANLTSDLADGSPSSLEPLSRLVHSLHSLAVPWPE